MLVLTILIEKNRQWERKKNHEYRAEKQAVPSDLRICTMSQALLSWQPDQKGM